MAREPLAGCLSPARGAGSSRDEPRRDAVGSPPPEGSGPGLHPLQPEGSRDPPSLSPGCKHPGRGGLQPLARPKGCQTAATLSRPRNTSAVLGPGGTAASCCSANLPSAEAEARRSAAHRSARGPCRRRSADTLSRSPESPESAEAASGPSSVRASPPRGSPLSPIAEALRIPCRSRAGVRESRTVSGFHVKDRVLPRKHPSGEGRVFR